MEDLTNDSGLNELEGLERELSSLVKAVRFGEQAPDAKRIWAKVQRAGTSKRGRVGFSEKSLRRWVGYGATFALVGIAAFLSRQEILSLITPKTQSIAFKEYRTVAGQRARLMLPDGSIVTLAPKSHIRYAANFESSGNRTISLEGQALFTVTHSTGVPFVVRADKVAARVLGTSFSVRRYLTDTNVQVVVAQGRVAVGSTVLNTGDIAVAADEQQIAVSRGNPVGDQLAWAEGRLVFYKTPLRNVIPDLERWYGITIEIADTALLDRHVIATFDNETASDAIDLVAYAVKGRATIIGSHVLIHSL